MLDAAARDFPDRDALVSEDRTFTFAQLREEVRTAAAAMITLGVQAGDRVAIWSPNSWHWVVACLAAHYAGAAVVPLNIAFTAGEAGDVLSRSGARMLVAAEGGGGVDRVAELDHGLLPELAHIVRVPLGSASEQWDLVSGPLAPASAVDARAAAVRPDDVADIMFTSGTTGRSKGVMCSHRQSLRSAGAVWNEFALSREQRHLVINPFFHIFGYKGSLLGCLVTGATIVPLRNFDPEQAMRVIAHQRITVLPGPPILFHALLDHPSRVNHDLSSLRLAVTGGATLPVVLVERIIRELAVETVLTGYGLTENGGFATICRPDDDPATVATTCGRPLSGFEVRISAPDGDGIGEVLLRGPNVMLGYLDDRAATAAAVDEAGWLHTGDLGVLDGAGNLRITGRLGDMFICGGVNVYPAEVEQVLARLDGVADAAVIGVPHERLGEVGRAFVVREHGADLDDHQVIAAVRQHLAPYKTPRSVVFLDTLPRNAGGKVLKTTLREIACTPSVPATPQGLGGQPVGAAENWVADAWQVLLNVARPGRRDRFTDLGGDSLAAVEFSHMLQTRFGVDMSVDALAGLPTIADVVAALEPRDESPRRPVVRLRAGDTGPVCLIVPGIGGHAWTFAAVANAITVACELWGVSVVELRAGPPQEIRQRIRTAAAETARAAAAQGRPLVLAGYSFGALIAADLGCWLTEQGIPIDRLLLLDPDPLESAPQNRDPVTLYKRPGILTMEPGSPAARQLAREVRDVATMLQTGYLDNSVRLPGVPVAWLRTRMMVNEQVGITTVFGTRVEEIDQTVVEVDHLDLIRIPHVTHLAGWLDRQLTIGN